MGALFVLALIGAISLSPFLFRYLLISTLEAVGTRLRNKTNGKRQLLLEASRAEEALLLRRQNEGKEADDDDWERVESHATATAENGGPLPGNDFAGIIGFFHPFCNAGGGGERVLWAAIRATQRRWPRTVCVVYSGDHDTNKFEVVERVYNTFGIRLHAPSLVFLYLSNRHAVLASSYSHFTLLAQSLGSLVVAYDAFDLLVPDIFIDTMGYAFASALCKYLFPKVPVGAYVHYPIISTDMLGSLDDESGQKGVNAGAGTGMRGRAKKQYWKLFARLYGWVGGHIDIVMCNSSWTKGHIDALWGSKKQPGSPAKVIYPPCPVEEMQRKVEVSAKSEQQRKHQILYIAQFRPEKNHPLILRSFAEYLRTLPKDATPPQLVLIGSVRSNTADELHIYNLRLQAHELKIDTHTQFITDAPYDTILTYLQTAAIGTNGMWNEHFGIGVVEYLAAGVIPVVHDSGGPKLDIVVPVEGRETGYHAESAEDFAAGFKTAMGLDPEERLAVRVRGRKQAQKFSEEVFARKWVEEIERLIAMQS